MTRPVDGHRWHALSAGSALRALEASHTGLTEEEVSRRRGRFGANRLPEARRAGPLRVFLRQFTDPLIYILLVAAAVSLAVGNVNNALFIFVVLLINARHRHLSELRAESGARELEEIVRIRATVERGGRRQEIDSVELVPGASSSSTRAMPSRRTCASWQRRTCGRTNRS